MQRLGPVINLTPSKKIVVKVEHPPKIGATVVDEEFRIIGKVFDIIGPVSYPYALVKPLVTSPERFIKSQLYTLPKKNKRRKWK